MNRHNKRLYKIAAMTYHLEQAASALYPIDRWMHYQDAADAASDAGLIDAADRMRDMS